MKRSLLIPLLGFVLFCDAPYSPLDFDYGKEFELAYEHHAYNNENDLTIYFKIVSEDSRCPIDVTCVWEGNARVLFEVNDVELALNTTLEPKMVTVGNYQIELLDLKPYPKEFEVIEQEDYRAQLLITKL